MAIAIFRSLEGESVEDVANRLFQQWRLGKTGLDNGVLLVVFVQDRKLRFEIGYGLEAVVPDAAAGQIIRQIIAPSFRDRRYAAGLEAAADAVYARIASGGWGPGGPRQSALGGRGGSSASRTLTRSATRSRPPRRGHRPRSGCIWSAGCRAASLASPWTPSRGRGRSSRSSACTRRPSDTACSSTSPSTTGSSPSWATWGSTGASATATGTACATG